MKENYRMFPYFILKIYIFLTLILSLFGPIIYGYDSFFAFLVCVYMFLFIFITKIGMLSSYNYRVTKYISLKQDKKLMRILKFLLIGVLIIKILLVLSSIKIYGIPQIKLNEFYSMFAEVYSELHKGEFKKNIYRQIDSFTTFIFYISTFIGLFWYKRLKFLFKIILFLNIILDFVYQILFIGTQRSIITIVVVFILLLTQKAVDKEYNISYKKLLKVGIVIIILAIIFINVLSARNELWNPNYYKATKHYNLESIWFVFVKNTKIKYDLCTILSYITQGYYGLSLTFQVDFEWTFFLGAFRGINSILLEGITSLPLMSDFSYPVRAGQLYNFDGYARWFTIFPWLASDFTFIGAILYMGIIAKVYMRCWIQTIKYKNPLAFTLLVLLSIQYIFVVANNQLFISRGESLATIIIFILYLVYNKNCNYYSKIY